MVTRWLNLHVPYACRHAGACCSSNWPIPLEQVRVAAIAALGRAPGWLEVAPGAPPDVAGVLGRTREGRCVFHQTDRRGCEIQSALGHAALPMACQHFPRRCLIDRRGVSVTLSHYCPTAAALLFTHTGPVAIVEGPPALPVGEPEGLDARAALPPSLTHSVLMDDEGHSAWEAHMVERLTANSGHTPEQRLILLEEDVRLLARWRPGAASLVQAVADLPAAPAVETSVDAWAPFSAVVQRFLAAHAFAAWVPYQSASLDASVQQLRTVLQRLAWHAGPAPMARARLEEAVRQTDLHVRHLAESGV